MRVLGIIAEYNPFHNGHEYHLRASKNMINPDYTVVVLSGNFVQRGEPAIIHKWDRTRMCLAAGVDLVIELPVYYSCASAEYFAKAAVKLLDSTGVITHLSFGAETNSADAFTKTVDIVTEEPPEYRVLVKDALSKGLNFPSARAYALSNLMPDEERIYDTPNNILGIEYLKALSKSGSNIKPQICQRKSSDHNSTALSEGFSSAFAIRSEILRGGGIKGLPDYSFKILSASEKYFPLSFEKYTDMLLYKIRNSSDSELAQIFDITEGLHNRIKEAASYNTLSDIISYIKTKRYTFTKIRRVLLHILLDIKREDVEYFDTLGGPLYIRILGFRKSAAPLLKAISTNASLPLVINLKKDIAKLSEAGKKMIEKEIITSDIYFIKCGDPSLKRSRMEFYRHIVKF